MGHVASEDPALEPDTNEAEAVRDRVHQAFCVRALPFDPTLASPETHHEICEMVSGLASIAAWEHDRLAEAIELLKKIAAPPRPTLYGEFLATCAGASAGWLINNGYAKPEELIV